jgi:long-chain fatty acid transport protein
MAQGFARPTVGLAGLTLALAPAAAEAGSGFAVRLQSLVALGMSQAGAATGAGGVGTMLANPATIAASSGSVLESASTVVMQAGSFRDIASENLFGAPNSGGRGAGAHEPSVLPTLHVAGDLSDTLRVGLAVAPLYGLASRYTGDWSGRYHVIDSEVLSVVAQPTIAWRATPWLSVGAGVQLQYLRSETTTAIDFGAIDAALAGGAFGGTPGQDDGRLRSTIDGFAAGFSVGALLTPAPGTRIGVGYRSAVTQPLDGDARFELGGPVGAGLSAATGAFTATGASSDARLPASLQLGVRQELGSGVTVYADINWMGWGRIDELALDFDNPAQERAVTALPWDDSIFVALGASWDVDDRLTLRGGAAYDQGPARDGGAAVAVPDGNSVWLGGGASYRLTGSVILDAALGAAITEDVDVVARASDPGGTFRGDFRGSYEGGRAYFGGLGLRVEF